MSRVPMTRGFLKYPGKPASYNELRFSIYKPGTGWLVEYQDGIATWGGPMEAMLFEEEKNCAILARELRATYTPVIRKAAEAML